MPWRTREEAFRAGIPVPRDAPMLSMGQTRRWGYCSISSSPASFADHQLPLMPAEMLKYTTSSPWAMKGSKAFRASSGFTMEVRTSAPERRAS